MNTNKEKALQILIDLENELSIALRSNQSLNTQKIIDILNKVIRCRKIIELIE